MLPSTKTSLTLQLESELLTAIDHLRIQTHRASLNEVVESILHQWYEARMKQLEQATEAYYRGITNQEREEDKEWTSLSSTQIDASYISESHG